MKDVVIVSPTPTWPLDFGNRKRIFQVANQLKAAGCRIHFILYALEQEWRTNSVFPEEEYRKLQEQWDFVHIVASTVGYHKSPDGDDHDLDEWWDPALEKFLWWYLHAQHIDAVIVNYIYLSRALTLAPPYTLKVLDTHDRFGGRRALLAKLGIQPEFFHLTIDDERRGLERADLVVAIKEEEEAYFQELSGRETLTAPFYEPIRPRSSSAASPPADGYLRVGLIGGRNSINRRSVERFLDRALPRIFATLAPIRVVLAGSMCADLEKYSS